MRDRLANGICNLALALMHTKEVAYKALVLPKLEYVAPIWNFYHKTQIGQVEKVQGTAARWRNTSTLAVPARPQIAVLLNLLLQDPLWYSVSRDR